MAITSGQTAQADDFILESEKNATESNDSGKVPQLESDGRLSDKFLRLPVLSKNATAGQAFTGATSPQPAFIGRGSRGGTDDIASYNQADTTQILTNFGYGGIGGGLKVAKKIVVGASPILVSKILARLSGTGGGSSVQVSGAIQADASGLPSGTNLASSSSQGVSGASADYTFTLSAAVAMAAGSTYWLVLETSSPVGTAGEVIGSNSGGASTMAIYDSGSWSVNANKAMRIKAQVQYTAGYIFMSNAALTESKRIDGFVLNNVSTGSTEVYFISAYGGLMISGFSGLSVGSLYYLHNTNAGEITTTTTSAVIVGIAISATTLFLCKTAT